MAAASGPLEPSAITTMTRCPSLSEDSPARCSAEACTNTSLPPPSRTIKPKPLVAVYHLTVPFSDEVGSSAGGSGENYDPFPRRFPDARNPVAIILAHFRQRREGCSRKVEACLIRIPVASPAARRRAASKGLCLRPRRATLRASPTVLDE